MTGQSASGFAKFNVHTTQFANAYRYCIIRSGVGIEASICPSERQTMLSCMWISVLRVLMRMVGIQLDTDVSRLETTGLRLIGELGFIFQANKTARSLRFSVPETPLCLAGLPDISTELPTLPWSSSPERFIIPPSEIVSLLSDSDSEVRYRNSYLHCLLSRPRRPPQQWSPVLSLGRQQWSPVLSLGYTTSFISFLIFQSSSASSSESSSLTALTPVSPGTASDSDVILVSRASCSCYVFSMIERAFLCC